jgi:anti-sigma regulatory factor (Ser/Thr protein kinase)
VEVEQQAPAVTTEPGTLAVVIEITEQRFPPEPASAAAARTFAVEAAQCSGDSAEVIALLTSELASNAVLHARTDFRVRVRTDTATIRVEVADASPALPARRAYLPDSLSGRGLHIVDGMSDRWGVVRDAAGKTVWFELAASNARSDGAGTHR